MKLKVAASLLTGCGLVLALVGIVQVEIANQGRTHWRTVTRTTHELARAVSALESLAYEWMLRPSQRPRRQWDILRVHIEEQIRLIDMSRLDVESPQSLRVALGRADQLFQNLTGTPRAESNPVMRWRIIDQLLVHTREMSFKSDLLLSSSMKKQDASARGALVTLYIGAGLIGLQSLVMIVMLRRRILRPLHDIEQATHRLALDQDNPPIPKRYDDEFGRLIDAFNIMTGRLRGLSQEMERKRVLEAEERLLENISESQPQPVWICDDGGSITWENPAFRDYFGSFYAGALWTDLIHPDERESIEALLRDASGIHAESNVECRLAAVSGWRWCMLRTAHLRTSSSANRYWICTATDIHQRREMEDSIQEARQRSETLNEISLELTRELDPLTLARSIVTAACDLLEGEFAVFHLLIPGKDGILQTTCVSFPSDAPEVFSLLEAPPFTFNPRQPVLGGGAQHVLWEGAEQDARFGSIALAPVPFYTATRDGYLVIAHRASGIFSSEDLSLLSSLGTIASAAVENARLHAIERTTAHLAESRNRQLIRTNNDLQEFAYVASHDLQEPLRMITSYLDLLQLRWGSAIDAEAMMYLGRATDSAARMTRLVKDLLVYSRAGHDGEFTEEVPLQDLVSEICEDLGARIAETEAEIVFVDLPVVRARRLLLRQVLQNLLQNALKYRHPERRPHVTVSVAKSGDDTLVHVTDNGLGIPEQHRDRIFRLFQRLDLGKAEGSGIGLSICRKLARAWGGEITVASDGEHGSTFTITLPRQSGNSTPSASFPALS